MQILRAFRCKPLRSGSPGIAIGNSGTWFQAATGPGNTIRFFANQTYGV
jgi:hypothetical protein